MDARTDGADAATPRRSRRWASTCRRSAARVVALAGQPAALAELQGQPARLRGVLGLSWCCSSSRCSPSFWRTTSRSWSASKARPIVPVLFTYPETAFGGEFETAADYRDPYLRKLIAEKGGSIWWPLIRFSYSTHNLNLPTPAPSPPTWMLTEAQCKPAAEKIGGKGCRGPRTQLARHRRSGPRRGGAADLRLPHLGAVRPHA